MSRTSLYGIIGLLAVLVVGLGVYLVYQQQQRPGLEIKLDDGGLKVNGNG